MIKKLDVVAAIIECDGKILLAQRPAHADQAGLWEFAGGKVEPGETQPQALIRELREELGIDATPGVYIASHQRDVSGRRIHLHAWHVPAFNGLILILVNAALNAGLGRLTARAENFRRDIHLNIRTTVLVCQPDHWHYRHHGDHEASAHRISLFF